MAEHNTLGKQGEQLALDYLIEQEYTIRETNWRFRKAEVDIIAFKNDVVVFIEVKTRSTDYFGEPEDSVTSKKQKMIIDAADHYAQKLDFEVELRFDIISIIKTEKTAQLKHIEDAFIPLLD